VELWCVFAGGEGEGAGVSEGWWGRGEVVGGWKGDEKGMGRGIHRRMELRGRNLTGGGAFVTVLDRRVYENGH